MILIKRLIITILLPLLILPDLYAQSNGWTKDEKAYLRQEMLRYSIQLGVFDHVPLESWESDGLRTLATVLPNLYGMSFDEWRAKTKDELIDETILIFDEHYDDLERQFGRSFVVLDSVYRDRIWRDRFMHNSDDIKGYWLSNSEDLPDLLILDNLFLIWSPIHKWQRFTATWSLSRDTLRLESSPYPNHVPYELFYVDNESIRLKYFDSTRYLVHAKRVSVEATEITRESLEGIWPDEFSSEKLYLNGDGSFRLMVGENHVEDQGIWSVEGDILILRGYLIRKERIIFLCDGDLFLERQYSGPRIRRLRKIN